MVVLHLNMSQSMRASVCARVHACATALTAVDSLDASVISRFPFSPTSAGTKIKTSEISLNTSQCWKRTQGSSNRSAK